MTEEQIKQKALDFFRKTKGREYHIISDTYTDEQIGRFYENEINLMIGFATEATKELQEENEQLKKKLVQTQDAVIMQMYTNKANKEQSEMKIADLEKQIEKMKNQWNCKNNNGHCVSSICPCKDKWELKE